MKNPDLATSVMKKVVAFERRRTSRWIAVSGAVIGVFAVVITVSLLILFTVASERKTWDILALIYEDPEIIVEYGRDAMAVLVDELPRQPLLFAGAATVAFVVFWLVTNHTRRVYRRRAKELAKQGK